MRTSQEQIVRQTVIWKPQLSSGGFPPVQTDNQAAFSYGQVGPVVPDTGSLELGRHRRRAPKFHEAQGSFLPLGSTERDHP